MKRRKDPALRMILPVAAVLVAAMACFLIYRVMPTSRHKNLYSYFSASEADEGAVITVGSQILEERGRIMEGEGYLPIGVVNRYLNRKYYYDEETEQVLYAGAREIYATPAGTVAGDKALWIGDDLYLSLSFVKEHTDLDTMTAQEPDRIAIQNRFHDVEAVTVNRKGNIRYRAGIKSEILTEVLPGDTLLYQGDLDNWVKVTSWDGLTGYIERGNVSNPYMLDLARDFREEAVSFLKVQEPMTLVWHNITSPESNDYLIQDTEDMEGVTVLSPTWFSVTGEDGSITGMVSEEYIRNAHAMGCDVWGLIDNFADNVSTYKVLSRYSSRQKLISSIMDYALTYGLDGINIDFEMLTEDSVPHFLEFLRELSIRTHAYGLVLSVDTPVPDVYTAFYDRAEQGTVVDYMIIMGYDEHYAGSESAGSVASLPWVERGVKDVIAEVPAERVVIGVPFYTRLWWTQAGTLYSELLGVYQQAERIPDKDVQSYWDKELHQTYASWDDNGIHYQIWMEDAGSIRDKTALVRTYGLAGTAAWRLGLETSELWDAVIRGQRGE